MPGDSALLVAGGLAADGKLALPAVIAVAAAAAFIGDSIAFEVGRRGGRRLLERDGRFSKHRRAVLTRADQFFARYGLMAIPVAKFIPGVRAVSALAAGAANMPRRGFAIVNLLACLTWTSVTASIAYAAGPTGALVLAGIAISVALAALVVGAVRRQRVQRRGATSPAERDPIGPVPKH